MAEPTITIVHLYPGDMNIYGDLGNIIALVRRLEWRGYTVKIQAVEVGEPFDFTKADIVFGGGGQDRGQLVVGSDLLSRGAELKAAVADGLPVLVVCGLYQLLGHGFVTAEGREIKGIGVFDAETKATTQRMIGNITIQSSFGPLVGFENHSGATVLASGQKPLGRVTKGFGNTPRRRDEGAVTQNAIGTYLHGPILPKNPTLADHLIQTALERRLGRVELPLLDDSLEQQAATVAAKRPQ